MPMPFRLLTAFLVVTIALTGCGGADKAERNDLRTTCGLIHEAMPQSTYDAKDNARLAEALADIAEDADAKAAEAIQPFVGAVDKLVRTAAQPGAFIDAHVDFLGAGEALDKTCRAAGAPAVLR